MKACSAFYFALFALVVVAAKQKPVFTVDEYFVGSWIVSSRIIGSDNEGVQEITEKEMFNITKSDSNLFAISHINKESNTVINESSMSFTMSSPLACDIQRTNEKKEIADFVSLQFHPLISDDSYIAFGVNPVNADESFEISTVSTTKFVIKVVSGNGKSITLYVADRIVSAPVPSFFQKYGNMVMMAVMVVVQLVSAKFRKQPEPQAEEEEKNEATEEKAKTE